jgi:hypothetical protein
VPYVIGFILALGVAIWATWVGFDRDRAFYPTVAIVVASYYGLFAILGGSNRALVLECIPIFGFLTASVLAFKRNLFWVVGALSAHGLFDFFHCHLIVNPGVPPWWPAFCMTYDLTAAGYLGWRLYLSRAQLQGH